MAISRKPTLEPLEDRLTPVNWGLAWPNPGHLTLSFVPDGTRVGAYQSDLFQTLNAVAPTGVWEEEILRAIQAWAVNANINVGVVADQGQPLGTSGRIQGDSRFGDIRIAMAPLAGSNHVADTMPFDLAVGTWAGDMIFNSLYNFGTGGAGQYDLYSVALHEAGHVYGFADEMTDPVSALYAVYGGVRTGLTSQDIAQLQGLYGGHRNADTQGNSTLATATFLPNLSQATVSADISGLTDSHYYSFSSGAANAGATTTALTVQVQTEGLSLLEPNVNVYDSNGNVVGSGAATDPINNNVSVQVTSALPNATYYVEVTGATNSVFGIGSYQMSVQLGGSTGQASNSAVSNQVVGSNAAAGAANQSFATALMLGQQQVSANTQVFTYSSGGALQTPAQIDFYQVTAPTLTGAGAELLTVSAASTSASGLNPFVQVFDASQNVLATTVINNANGTFTVQLPGIVTGSTYYVEASALPGANQNVGSYSLTVQFNNVAATTFNQLAAGALTQSTTSGQQSISLGTAGVMQFALAASTQTSLAAAQVQVTIYDQNNNQVFTMSAASGQPLSTGFTYLAAGTYTAVFSATAAAGGSVQSLSCTLGGLRISDPQVAMLVDPTLSPTGTTTATGTAPTGTPVGTAPTSGNPPVSSPISSPVTSSPPTSTSTASASSTPTTAVASAAPATPATTAPTTTPTGAPAPTTAPTAVTPTESTSPTTAPATAAPAGSTPPATATTAPASAPLATDPSTSATAAPATIAPATSAPTATASTPPASTPPTTTPPSTPATTC